MSNFDPSQPPGDPNPVCTSVALQTSTTASASTAFTVTNYNHKGVIAYFNIASLPGSGSTTLALKIQSVIPGLGTFSNLLAAAARSASGTTVMMVSPSISSSALGAGVPLPRDLRFLVSQSSGATSKDCVWSLGIHFTV